jgi:multidrug resistance efflux pump
METTLEKLTEENATLRAKLQTMEAQFVRLTSRDFYQAFRDQTTRANGLELEYGNVRRDLGELQRVYNHNRANWGRTVDRLKEQLTSAQTEITYLKSQVQEIKEGRPPAKVSEQSTEQPTDLRL